MFKIMINDIFITNINTFNIVLNKQGQLALSLHEDLIEKEDIVRAESVLSILQTYTEVDSIIFIKIVDLQDNIIFESSKFSAVEMASIMFTDEPSTLLEITIV